MMGEDPRTTPEVVFNRPQLEALGQAGIGGGGQTIVVNLYG